MLVEDAPEIRRRLLKMLAQMPDIEIAAATSGVAESIRALRETHPDTVLLDLRLADGSGFDVLRAIKAGHGGPAVIMLTSFPSEGCRRRFMALGGDYLFDKSLQLGDALALLGKLARRARSRRSQDKTVQ
jgi:DNA-binding response OmpR family regulator